MYTIPSTICWERAWIDHHDGRNVDRAIITLRHVVHVVILYPRKVALLQPASANPPVAQGWQYIR